jgi:hypothetical protein
MRVFDFFLDKELGSQVRCLKSVELTLYFTSINANCIRCCKVGIKAREEHILDVQQELKTTAAYTHSIQSFCLFVCLDNMYIACMTCSSPLAVSSM